MKTIVRGAGAVLLFVCAAGIVGGHDLLARWLASCAPGGEALAARLATVGGSLVVQVVTGVFVLPLALQARRFGVPVDAVRIAVWTALFAVIGRAGGELVAGALVAGYPVLVVATATAALSVALARHAGRRPWGVRGVVRAAAEPVRGAASRETA